MLNAKRTLRVDDAGELTPYRHSKIAPSRDPGSTEPGREEVLSVQDWAEIRRLHRAEGLPIKQMARVLGLSRNTVRSALRADGPPKCERVGQASIVDEVEPRIRELLQAFPTMPATVIAGRIGWTRVDDGAREAGGRAAAGPSAA